MSMGDELAASTVHVATNAAQATVSIVSNLVSDILKMLYNTREHNLRMSELKLKSGIDMTDIKSGKVKLSELVSNARKSGDSITTAQHGITTADATKLAGLAKNYGLPVAFSQNGNDSMHAHVRSRDLPIFKQVFTDLMRDKLITKPQSIGNFKVQTWEIPYITTELNKYNLNAQFGRTKNGDYFCMYEKADEKAILIARGEFIRKYNDVKQNFSVIKDQQGFYIIKDTKTGKEISFDDKNKSYSELSDELQRNFGYDKNKASIAAAKFGEENLKGEIKENYFKNPQNNVKSIITNIAFENDDIYASQYTCMRVVPKHDAIQRIVFTDKAGRFAVISPEMKTREMAEVLKEHLQITDKKEINSLINKAEKALLFYSKREDATRYSSTYDLSNKDDKLEIDIERIGKDNFTVKTRTEANEKKESIGSFSFSDKKKSIHDLEQLFISQGVPEVVAKNAAFDTFAKAQSQEVDKIIVVEEIKTETSIYYNDNLKVEADVYYAGKSAIVDITDENESISNIKEAFNVPDVKASELYTDISNKITDKQLNLLETYGYDCDNWTVREAAFVINKIATNQWNIPKGMEPNNFSLDKFKQHSDISANDTIPELDTDVISMGGR